MRFEMLGYIKQILPCGNIDEYFAVHVTLVVFSVIWDVTLTASSLSQLTP